jgi:hypothetical protein
VSATALAVIGSLRTCPSPISTGQRFVASLPSRCFRYVLFRNSLLGGVPGGRPRRSSLGRTRKDDNLALQRFITEWESTLTILRKLAKKAESAPGPSWIDPSVPSLGVQDQATEYWWHTHVRRNEEHIPAQTMMMQYHDRNRDAPDGVVDQLFEEWSGFEASDAWAQFLNVAPIETRELLSRESLAPIDVDGLTIRRGRSGDSG